MLEPSGSEWDVMRGEDIVCHLAISHKKGGKREIKPIYLRRFREAIAEMEKDDSAVEGAKKGSSIKRR